MPGTAVSSAKGPGRSSSRVPDDITTAPERANVVPRVPRRACEAPRCGRELPSRRRRFCTDECRRRGQKAERVTENDTYAASVVRQIDSMGVRASADVEALRWLAGAVEHARGALAMAVDGCRARGYSDAEIGRALDISRQAVGQRFGRKRDVHTGTPESGAAR